MSRFQFSAFLSGALVALTVCVPSLASAQDENLIHGGAGGVGFYAAPVVKLTEVSGRSDVLGGVRAGVIFGRRFGVGLAAYGSGGGGGFRGGPDGGPRFSRASADIMGGNGFYGPGNRNDLSYGGLELEYIMEPAKLVHASISTLFGGGSMRANDQIPIPAIPTNGTLIDGPLGGRGPGLSFFVAEPGANAEINVVKHVRLALGVGYRFTAGSNNRVSSAGYTNGSGAGATGTLALKFGKL